MKVIVTNIQRFCLHDGPGIRTTVFFKGCNLRCPWCSNPENINFEIEDYKEGLNNGKYGYEIELENLEKEILKDKFFYKDDGGVTFSGGEALLQFEKIEPLLASLKEKNINMCIETALSVPTKFVDIAIKYIDEFIIDVKILDEKNINKIKGNVELFKNNIEKLYKKNNNIVFRIPLAKDYIVTDENVNLILEFLNKYKPKKVEIFKIHDLGEKKYKTLNREMIKLNDIEQEEIEEIKSKIEQLDIKVEFCKI